MKGARTIIWPSQCASCMRVLTPALLSTGLYFGPDLTVVLKTVSVGAFKGRAGQDWGISKPGPASERTALWLLSISTRPERTKSGWAFLSLFWAFY